MLSENERRVYAEARKAAKRGERATISSIAHATGVPRSSVANVAAKLGYRGWVDMTTQLVGYYASFRQDDAVGNGVDVVTGALRRARGRVVLLDAIGDSEICLDYLLFRLCENGFCAMPYSAGVIDALRLPSGISDASEAGEGTARHSQGRTSTGALIVINESGMSLMPSCVKASGAGMEIVAITASHDSPVSKLSQVNVVIKNNKSTPDAYEPNYFTAGVLVFMERVLAACAERV